MLIEIDEGKFAGVSSPEKKHSAHSEQREDSMLVLQKLGSFSLDFIHWFIKQSTWWALAP
jgi:hypothetical protein